MKKILLSLTVFIIAVTTMAVTTSKHSASIHTSITNTSDSGFVLMELFTSQGCSSCPAADEVLGEYAQMNDSRIIPIAFHVDYWNQLGWRDSFSTHQYSVRQNKYDADFLHASVYTPQLIINGEKEFIGSNKEAISKAVDAALNKVPSVTIHLINNTVKSRIVNIQYTTIGNIASTTINFVLIQHKTTTEVKAGENNGVTLVNYNVVRHLLTTKAKEAGMSMLQLPAGVSVSDLILILFTQDKNSGKITGAIKKEL